MPRQGWILLGALATFAAVVMGMLAWAQFSGNAGSQRGLVIFSELDDDIVVTFENGESGMITPDDERIFVVRRGEFPSSVRVTDDKGQLLIERLFEYEEFVKAEFRLSIDERGFYPTATYRDTPVPEGG
jgi:hypothetical protein